MRTKEARIRGRQSEARGVIIFASLKNHSCCYVENGLEGLELGQGHQMYEQEVP